MLVLQRFIGQSVKLSGGITVMVVDIIGNKVKLGFDAPRDVTIVRDDAIKLKPPAYRGGTDVRHVP